MGNGRGQRKGLSFESGKHLQRHRRHGQGLGECGDRHCRRLDRQADTGSGRALITHFLTPSQALLFYIFVLTVHAYSAHLHKHLPPALFALSLTGSLAMHSFTSPWLWVSWLAVGFGALLLLPWQTGPRALFISLLLLMALVWAAIPGSLLWGSGNWILSAGVAIWMAPSILFYLTSNGKKVFAWLVPTWLIHAGLIIYQSCLLYTSPSPRD